MSKRKSKTPKKNTNYLKKKNVCKLYFLRVHNIAVVIYRAGQIAHTKITSYKLKVTVVLCIWVQVTSYINLFSVTGY